MMTAQRKRRARLSRRISVMIKRRSMSSQEDQTWDRMRAVGRVFGGPDFARLMEEGSRLGRGGFDPALVISGTTRRLGFMKGRLTVPQDFDAALPEDLLAGFEGERLERMRPAKSH